MAEQQAPALLPEAPRLGQLADGLDVLIRFHDREVDDALITELHQHRIADGLAELFSNAEGQGAVRALIDTLDDLGKAPSPEDLDLLAADYADLYLTHGHRVAPNGSVWLTEDKLERQLPMFEVREWYEHYGISVPDWRKRADDHLVHELQFLSFLLRRSDAVSATDAAGFLDQHVLPWMPEFCRQAAGRVAEPLYAAIMALTLALLDEIRTLLEAITGQERQVRDYSNLGSEREMDPEAQPFIPGASESW